MVGLSSLALFLTPTAHAGQVTTFDQLRIRFHSQTDATQPLAPYDFRFVTRIFLDTPLTTATSRVFLPGSALGLSMGTSGALFSLIQDFPTQAALDQAFPPGQYNYTLDSAQLTPATSESGQAVEPATPPPFTNVPYFTNFAAIQYFDPTKPFDFTWNPIVAPPSPLFPELFFRLRDVATDAIILDTYIPDHTATSYTVPANTLRAGRRYVATIYFNIQNQTTGAGFATAFLQLNYENLTRLFFTTGPRPADFNGDGHRDYLFFRASDLRTYVWYMNGPTAFSSASGPTLPAGWSVVGVGDFNADGKPDLLLFHASDLRTYVWYMNGPNVFSSAPGPTLPTGWSVLDVGDFNDDGQPDLLLLHASDLRTYIYYMHGPTAFSSAPGPTLPAGWSMVGLGDFNNDGKPDILFFNPTSLQTYVWYMNGPTAFSSAPGPTLPAGWSVAGVGEFN